MGKLSRDTKNQWIFSSSGGRSRKWTVTAREDLYRAHEDSLCAPGHFSPLGSFVCKPCPEGWSSGKARGCQWIPPDLPREKKRKKNKHMAAAFLCFFSKKEVPSKADQCSMLCLFLNCCARLVWESTPSCFWELSRVLQLGNPFQASML